MQEIIVGRSGNQPFKIDDKKYYHVHGEHAKITVLDDKRWMLEDLKNGDGNGVYVRNDMGVFKRVIRQEISPKDTIRLGPEGVHSFVFTAYKVNDKSGTDSPSVKETPYKREFIELKKRYKMFGKEEERLEKLVKRHRQLERVVPSLGMGVMCLPLDNFGLNPMMVRGAVLVLALAGTWFISRGDSDKLKELRERKEALLVCPCCQRPLSKYDIKNRRCTMCKAE